MQTEIAIANTRRQTEVLLREKEAEIQAVREQAQTRRAVSEAERIAEEITSQSDPSPQHQNISDAGHGGSHSGTASMDIQDDRSPPATSPSTLGAQGIPPCNTAGATSARVNVTPMDTGSDSTTLGAQDSPSNTSGAMSDQDNATSMDTRSDSTAANNNGSATLSSQTPPSAQSHDGGPSIPSEQLKRPNTAPRHTSGTVPMPKYPPGRHRAQGKSSLSTVRSQRLEEISETDIMEKLNCIMERLNQTRAGQHKSKQPVSV